MSASTNFKQFNPSAANCLSDANYTANTARQDGVSSGVFPSNLANKLYYQASTMAAALAQMMVDKGLTVEDGSAGTTGHDFAALVAILSRLIVAGDLYGVDTGGTANTYVVTVLPNLGGHVTGVPLWFKVGAAHGNTGTCTINPNGFGAKSIVHPDGSALSSGALVSGQMVCCMYDGAAYQLLSRPSPMVPNSARVSLSEDFYVTAISPIPVTGLDVTLTKISPRSMVRVDFMGHMTAVARDSANITLRLEYYTGSAWTPLSQDLSGAMAITGVVLDTIHITTPLAFGIDRQVVESSLRVRAVTWIAQPTSNGVIYNGSSIALTERSFI